MPIADTTPLDTIVANLSGNWDSIRGLENGRIWNQPVVTFALGAGVSPPAAKGEDVGFVPLGPNQTARANDAFALWNELIDRMTLVPIVSVLNADITLANTNSNGGAFYATLTVGDRIGGRGSDFAMKDAAIWLNAASPSIADGTIAYGTYGFEVMLHEIGHALGLSHPGPYDAKDDPKPNYAQDARFPSDSRQYTIMSYFGGMRADGTWVPTTSNKSFSEPPTVFNPMTPMLYDILAIQSKYGVDFTTRSGNTTYGFNASGAGWDFFDFTKTPNPVFTIWDGGGIDTLDASGYARNQVINLTPGTFSSLLGLTENVAIAFSVGPDPERTLIENAVGGGGDDSILGNIADNTLQGGAGNDTIKGGVGRDSLDGGAGADILDGGGSGTLGPDGVDVLTGGANLDTFVYGRGYGRTTVTDFGVRERLDLTGATVHSYDELLQKARQVGPDLVFDFSTPGATTVDILTLQGFRLNAFDPGMATFSERTDSPPAAFQLLPNPAGNPGVPYLTSLASLGAGGFAIVEQTSQTYPTQAITARVFDDRGVDTGRSFQVNTTPFGTAFDLDLRVASIGDGNFVALWASNDTGGGGTRCLRARIFDDDGTPLGNDFVVNATAPAVQISGGNPIFNPSIRVNAGGSFTVTWLADLVPGDASFQVHLFARNFAADGTPGVEADLGPPTGPFDQTFSKTLPLQGGGSVRYWVEEIPGPVSRNYHLFAQILGVGAPVQIDQDGLIAPERITAAQLADGRIAFDWIDGTLSGFGGSTQIYRGASVAILDADLRGFTRPGTSGDDLLVGGPDNDRLYGLGGNDTLVGMRGADVLDGGAGRDLVTYAASLAGVTVALFDPGPQAGGHAEGDRLVRVENLVGSAYGDSLTGSASRNELSGGFGDDTLVGISTPGLAGDILRGEDGNDSLVGGAGADTMIGGDGSDAYEGGPGDDIFVLRRGDARGDNILDFERAGAVGGDVIMLRGYAAGAVLQEIAPGRYVVTVGGVEQDPFFMPRGLTLVAGEDYVFV